MSLFAVVAGEVVVCHREPMVIVLSQFEAAMQKSQSFTILFLFQEVYSKQVANVANLNAEVCKLNRISTATAYLLGLSPKVDFSYFLE